MKRFTDTEKWNNPNFRRLSEPYKLLYLFLLDACDNAGVIHVDVERFSFILGHSFTLEAIKENLGDKVLFFKDKMALVGFVRFQCGELSIKCHPHKRVIELLKKHGLEADQQMGII